MYINFTLYSLLIIILYICRFTTTIDPASLNEQQLQEIADRERHIEYESIADYGSKGYMPIRCGQLLGRKTYKIIRKFGYGQFSTVWLCHNKK